MAYTETINPEQLKYFKIGDNYYTVGDKNTLQQISQNDIIGRTGDLPAGTDAFSYLGSQGAYAELDPTKLSLVAPDNGETGYQKLLYGDQYIKGGGSEAYVRDTGTANLLGLNTTGIAPGEATTNQDFAQYLGDTGQTYDPTTGFSGGVSPTGQKTLGTQETLQGQAEGTINSYGQPTGTEFADAQNIRDNRAIAQQNTKSPQDTNQQLTTTQYLRQQGTNEVYAIGSDGGAYYVPYEYAQANNVFSQVEEVPFAINQKYPISGNALQAGLAPKQMLSSTPGMGQDSGTSQVKTPEQQIQKAENVNTLLGQYGITADANAFQVNPIKSFGDLYKSVITQLGLPDLKAQVNKVLGEQKAMNQELADKVADINEDPWLTEGVRISRIRKLQERYEGKLSALNSSLQLMQSLYEEGAQEARFVASETLKAYNSEREFQQDQLEFAINRQDKIAEAERELKQQQFDNELDLKKYALDVFKANQEKSGLTPAQINATVNSIANSFDNEPIVKGYNTVQEGFQTIQSIGVNTQSPADDIAFIYAFAKIMDPNSVVREGEYNTIQKYAQTWADNFGFSAKRIFSNTNFLTPDAKQKMLNALQPKVDTITSQYQNVYSEYQRRIEEAKAGGFNSLTDYSNQTQENDDPLNIFGSNDDPLGLSFNSEGGGSINAIAEAIGQIESSGNYTARGPQTSSGDYAYGKYQIMGANIPSWSKEALGYSITKDQFLKSPQLQDQIAYYKMNQYLQKYGSADNVATAWFAGPGAVNTNSQAQDVTGTSVPEYLRRFRTALNSYA